MAVTVGANLKDENYFAQAAGWTTRTRPPVGGNGRPNRENGRLARLFHDQKGEPSPPSKIRRTMLEAATVSCR
jgi:hypothetical protein